MRRRLFDVLDVLRHTSSSREEAEQQAAEELSRATSAGGAPDGARFEPDEADAGPSPGAGDEGGREPDPLPARPWATPDEPPAAERTLEEQAVE